MSARDRHYREQRLQDRLGDAPVQEEFYQQMIEVVRGLDVMFNGKAGGPGRRTGFVLMVYPFNEPGRCNYMSNGADRRDVVVLMREMIARFEGQAGGLEGHA